MQNKTHQFLDLSSNFFCASSFHLVGKLLHVIPKASDELTEFSHLFARPLRRVCCPRAAVMAHSCIWSRWVVGRWRWRWQWRCIVSSCMFRVRSARTPGSEVCPHHDKHPNCHQADSPPHPHPPPRNRAIVSVGRARAGEEE
jgi:hypothetical protein